MNSARKLRAQAIAFIMLTTSLATGCGSLRTAGLRADCSQERAQIAKRLEEIFSAAESKDFQRLDSYHFYGPKFTKFMDSSAARLDATAARTGEHKGLGAIQELKMRARDLQIDIFGNVAVATFILENSYVLAGETRRGKERSTLVFVRDGREWKIEHEHFSPIKP